MVTFEEPVNETDPMYWLVYADWLFEDGRYEEEERARNIAEGMRKTGGVLWLVLDAGDKTFASCANSPQCSGPFSSFEYENNDYWWDHKTPDKFNKDETPHNPFVREYMYSNQPTFKRRFLGTMAQIGASHDS